MKQHIQDFVALLKRDRKTQVITAIAGIALAFLIFGEGNEGTRLPKRKILQKDGSGAMNAQEAFTDLITRFNADLDTLKTQAHETSVALEQQVKRNKEMEERTAEILKRILERIAENEAALVNANLSGGAGSAIDVGEGNPDSGNYPTTLAEEDELETIGFEEPPLKLPGPPPPRKLALVGAGDSVRVKLLAGVNAPTDGTPYPVVFELVGDVNGPDGSALPLGSARLIAAAQGSLTDSRALFRLSSLNVRLPDGRRKVLSVDGWVVGEDGLRGMEGALIDPLGKAIGGAVIAGGLDGLGQAAADNQVRRHTDYYGGTEEIVTGDEATYAAGRALSSGAREWSSLIRERANMLVPHVEVLSGREGTAVFMKSFVVDDLFESLETDTAHFASLD